MSFQNGILNLTNWSANVILPTLAGLFIIIAIVQFSKGADYSRAMYGDFLCLMASGLLRALETFTRQRAWNNPDQYWIALVTLVDWLGNVILPLYAALQVAAGAGDLMTDVRFHHASGWMRHFAAAGLCLLVSGFLRLGEFFVKQGTGGVP